MSLPATFTSTQEFVTLPLDQPDVCPTAKTTVPTPTPVAASAVMRKMSEPFHVVIPVGGLAIVPSVELEFQGHVDVELGTNPGDPVDEPQLFLIIRDEIGKMILLWRDEHRLCLRDQSRSPPIV